MSAVYPLHNANGLARKRASVWVVALGRVLAPWEDDDEDATLTICAFCFITSAGVMIAQDTNSPTDEAMAWMIGCGSKGEVDDPKRGLWVDRRDLVPSYVVKKAPANSC